MKSWYADVALKERKDVERTHESLHKVLLIFNALEIPLVLVNLLFSLKLIPKMWMDVGGSD